MDMSDINNVKNAIEAQYDSELFVPKTVNFAVNDEAMDSRKLSETQS